MFNVNHFIVSQTNPHLVPLMSLRKVVPAPVFNLVQAEVKHAFLQVLTARTLSATWICSTSVAGMPMHFKHVYLSRRYVPVMQAQQYLPSWIPTKWMRLFTQPWEGDVTILMPWHLYMKNIGKAIHNPSQQDLVIADREGHRAAWEHISAIQVWFPWAIASQSHQRPSC